VRLDLQSLPRVISERPASLTCYSQPGGLGYRSVVDTRDLGATIGRWTIRRGHPSSWSARFATRFASVSKRSSTAKAGARAQGGRIAVTRLWVSSRAPCAVSLSRCSRSSPRLLQSGKAPTRDQERIATRLAKSNQQHAAMSALDVPACLREVQILCDQSGHRPELRPTQRDRPNRRRQASENNLTR
jgi:hypothetical protein